MMLHPIGFWGAPESLPITMDAGNNVSSQDNGFSDCGNPGTTGAPSATASGGEGALTYLWEQTGTPAGAGPYNCSNTAALNPTWSKNPVCEADTPIAETWRLTVTDEGIGNETDTISVSLKWTNIS